jgi:pimeloyl-ACP methyl ester carboxylesterase
MVCRTLGVLLIAFAALCTWFYFSQPGILLAPDEATTDAIRTPADLATTGPFAQDYVLLPEDHLVEGASLHCRLYRVNHTTHVEPKGVVAYLHGNRGNIHECRFQIEMFLEAGYDVAMMDYRSFGYSEGTLNENNLLNDALLWYDDLQSKKCKGQRLMVWGRSFGSGVAAYIASERTPDLLVLETPYYSFVDCVRAIYPVTAIIPTSLFCFKLPTCDFLQRVRCPVHLIHGDQDEKIYFGSSERLEAICKAKGIDHKLWRIPGDDHNLRELDAKRLPEFIEAISTILQHDFSARS